MKSKQVEILEEKKKEIEEQLNKEKKLQKTKPKKNGKLYFYEFNQNNSGGSFDVDDKVCHRVIIEAPDYTTARQKALDLGIYFDGCSNGMDCSCCGDRWSDYNEEPIDLSLKESGTQEPYIYSHYKNAEKLWKFKFNNFKVIEKPKWVVDGSRMFKGKIKTNTIELYAQYQANEYGWTTPDIRIFYNNGKIKEIFSKEIPKELKK